MKTHQKNLIVLLTVAALALAAVASVPAPTADAAQTLPFSARFTVNANGAIVAVGNTLLTCPASDACTQAKAGKASNNNNNAYDMVNLDADSDPSTFNSSMSTLSLPTGASVLWAGLYWGARLTAGTNGVAGNANAINQMSLRVPGAASYQTVAADTSADALFGPYSAGNNAYQRYADVTSIVAAAGNGDYWGANVVAGTGADRYAGWSLVVVYSAPGLPLRNLTVFDGFTNVGASSPQTITVSGFAAPLAGPVDTTLTMVAYEGDMTQTGDFTKLNGTQLATALSPGSNFFNSTNDWFGTSVTTRDPADKNMLGFDIKNIGASGIIGNGDTSATFTFGSTGDAYYPGVLATAINLYAPDFTASSKTALDLNGNSPAQPGDVVAYTVNYINTGQDPATNLVSTDPLPAGMEYVPGSLRLVSSAGATLTALTDAVGDDVGEFDPASNAVRVRLGVGATATAGGTLGLGATESYSFQARVLTAAAGTTVTNTAHLAYTTGTTKISATYDTPPVSFDVQTQADVSIAKTMSPATAANGSPITVTLTVTNHGPNTATGVQVTDPVPDGFNDLTVDVSGAPSGTTCSLPTPTPTQTPTQAGAGAMVCDLSSLPNGTVATIALRGTMAPSTPASQLTMTNIAHVTATTYDPDLSNNTASDTIALAQQADLSVVKTADAATVTPGGTVTYTVTVTNHGPSDATGVVLADTVGTPDALSLTGASVGAGGLSCGTVAAGGVSCTMATLAAGASASAHVTGQVAPGAAAGAPLVNQASVSSSTPDPDLSNNTASATLAATAPSADVRVTKAVFPATLVAGGPVAYTITATNWGPSDAAGVVVSDTLPDSIVANSATNSRGTCDVTGQTVTCQVGTLLASLDATKPGASATVTVFGTVAADASGTDVANTASATATTPDPDMSNNQATATAPLTTLADVAVSKTATMNGAIPTTLPAAGDKVVYTVTVVNHGPSDAQYVTVDDTLPAGLELDPAASIEAPTGGTCSTNTGTSDTFQCSLVTLAVGASVDITVPTLATTAVPGTGTMDETVTVTSPTPDPVTSNNTATWTLSGDPQADLALSKTTSTTTPFQAGGTATYDLTVTNNGPNSSVPTVTDTLPDGLTPLASGETGFDTSPQCTASGQTFTCEGIPLASGDSVTYHISVAVSPDLADGSSLTNTAHVDGSIADPSTGNNDATLTVPVSATTNIVTTAMTWNGFSSLTNGPGTVLTSTPNGTFVWLTMTFTNDGLATAQNASFLMDYDLNLTNLASSGAPIVDWNWTGSYAGWRAEPDCKLVQAQISCPIFNGPGGGTSLAPGQSVTVSMLIGVRGDSPNAGKGWVTAATTTSEGDPAVYPDNYTDNYQEAPLTITSGLTQPTITKTAAPGPGPNGALVAGGTFSYTIQVYQQQHAALPPGLYWSDAAGVQVTDPLPTGFHATSVTTSQGTCAIGTGGTSVSCDVGTVPGTFLLAANQTGPKATVTISGTIAADAPTGSHIPNTATMTTTSATYPTPGPFTATAYVDVAAQADLQLFKHVDATPTTDADGNPVYYAGGQVGYTLTALNAGPSESGASMIIDTLPLGLSLDTAGSPGCVVAKSGDIAKGNDEIVTCAVGALAAGQSQSVRVVANTLPQDTRLPGTGPGCVPGDPSNPANPSSTPNAADCDQYPAHPRTIVNKAVLESDDTTTGTPSDPDPTNNTATAKAVLDVQADLALTESVDTPNPAAGNTVNYTIIAINKGPSAADYPTADFTFPAGFVPTTWVTPGSDCKLSHDDATPPVYTLTCTAIPAAPDYQVFLPGQAVANVITVQIPENTPAGTYTATATMTSQTADPDMTNNDASADVTVQQVSDLGIVKALVDPADPNPLVAGQTATYELTVTNAGPSAADNVIVSDTVPVSMTFASAKDATCVTALADATTVLYCPLGTLEAGSSTSLYLTFTVNADTTQDPICNSALVGSSSLDPKAADNESQACANVEPEPSPEPTTPPTEPPTTPPTEPPTTPPTEPPTTPPTEPPTEPPSTEPPTTPPPTEPPTTPPVEPPTTPPPTEPPTTPPTEPATPTTPAEPTIPAEPTTPPTEPPTTPAEPTQPTIPTQPTEPTTPPTTATPTASASPSPSAPAVTPTTPSTPTSGGAVGTGGSVATTTPGWLLIAVVLILAGALLIRARYPRRD